MGSGLHRISSARHRTVRRQAWQIDGSRFLGIAACLGSTADLVEKAIRVALEEAGSVVTGISCMADGADQIFARAVTDLGGSLEAIIPAVPVSRRLAR